MFNIVPKYSMSLSQYCPWEFSSMAILHRYFMVMETLLEVSEAKTDLWKFGTS